MSDNTKSRLRNSKTKNQNPMVDAYIAKSAEFARPILKKVRMLFHRACPEIEETMKWGFPHFEYKGIVGSMAAFKQHASFGFWKGKLLKDWHEMIEQVGRTSMGGVKITDVSELPPDNVMLTYIREAVELNEKGVKTPRPKKKATRKEELKVPDYLLAALKKNKKALANFNALSHSHKKDYIEWLTEAKQEQTRLKRLETALDWIGEGKPRNWKYMARKNNGRA